MRGKVRDWKIPEEKLITAEEWAKMVKDGDWIYVGGPGADPTICLDMLGKRLGDGIGKVKNIEVWGTASTLPPRIMQKHDPEGKYWRFHEYFFLGPSRHWRDSQPFAVDWGHWGWAECIDYLFYRWYPIKAMDWAVLAGAPPENGIGNWSYGVNNSMFGVSVAKKVVYEIRDDYAWCEPGRNVLVSPDEIDYFVEVDTSCKDYQWPQIDERAMQPSKEEEQIARNIGTIMGDGDCLQVGIGGIPTAVVREIRKLGLKHLGGMSEMMGEWCFTLMEHGNLDNSMKTLDPGRATWTYIMPFDKNRYMKFLDHNPQFAAYDIFYTNNPSNLARQDHQIGINAFVMMDLYGQDVCSNEGGRPISGVGGQWVFVFGCSLAKGGRGVLATTSRDKKGHPRFVPTFPPYTVVDVPAQMVNYVATEWGIVNLRGKTSWERVWDIISIAHPDDRPALEKAAREMKLIPPRPVEKRYPEYHKHLRDFKHPYVADLTLAGDPFEFAGVDFSDDQIKVRKMEKQIAEENNKKVLKR